MKYNTIDDYELIISVKEKLLEEINHNNNRFINMDYSKYLF